MEPDLDLLKHLSLQEPPKHLAKSILQKVAQHQYEQSRIKKTWLVAAAAIIIGVFTLDAWVYLQQQKSQQLQVLNQMAGNQQNQLYHE